MSLEKYPVVGEYGSLERFLAPVYKRLAPVKEQPMSQYIIWNPASPLPPTKVFSTRPEAIRVAGKMAHSEPGATFYVCKLTNSACKPIPVDVTYEDLDK